MLPTIDRVLALQRNEIFAEVSTDGLAHMAAIAEEVEFHDGDWLFREGAAADACYLILAGEVVLTRGGQIELTAGPGEDIGVWALFDGEPRAYAAQAKGNTHALRISQDDFYDLLADHRDVIQTLFRTVVRRIRRILSDPAATARDKTGSGGPG
ncbi:MAG TPA: cyclic nucleotide-binding domain-containing protein [candidate division Zixibacteria bacterium]|nr:cyclic nucleotide-binding domain-containing protein [candidate division Zixibacteria bacterium]